MATPTPDLGGIVVFRVGAVKHNGPHDEHLPPVRNCRVHAPPGVAF
jgi:hypothetical protein